MAQSDTEKAPSPLYPVPTAAQIAWQRLETYAFVHFGLNTFTDLEWGYGDTPAATFAPDTLDVEQWMRTFVASGMKGVILTAKHHDGFCLWPTKTTDYSVKNSPWKGGHGDLVRELSEACRRHGLLFGIYLSPWDRRHREYGRTGYRTVFLEQIRELATNYGSLFEYWFDGANGGTGWYGGANETRSIDPITYYQYEQAAEILKANNPDIMIFGGTVPTIRWIGNERGWAGETNYSTYDFSKEKYYKEAQWGMRGANQWLPGEVDVSIRPGWFYHKREDHQVRSVADLTNLYYQSVGRNANLLLNFPIDINGRIPQLDSLNAVRWHQHITKSFENNLFKGAKVYASPTRHETLFSPQNITDDNPDTYWATPDHQQSAEIIIELPKRAKINTISLQEYIHLGQRIDAFSLETRDSLGQWQPIETADSLTTIGYKRLIRLRTTSTDGLRLTISRARASICLAEISAHYTPVWVEAPSVYRNVDDRLIATPASPRDVLSFRVDGGNWQMYQDSLLIPHEHTSIEMQALSEGGTTASILLPLGYSAKRITTPTISSEDRTRLLDGNGYTAVEFMDGIREISLVLDTPKEIRRIEYIPNQQRDASGHISQYDLYIDGKQVATGEFANIKHNPIATSIILPHPIVGQRLRLVARQLTEGKRLTVGSLLLH